MGLRSDAVGVDVEFLREQGMRVLVTDHPLAEVLHASTNALKRNTVVPERIKHMQLGEVVER